MTNNKKNDISDIIEKEKLKNKFIEHLEDNEDLLSSLIEVAMKDEGVKKQIENGETPTFKVTKDLLDRFSKKTKIH